MKKEWNCSLRNLQTDYAGCIYLERDIQSRLNRYAADAEITDVWVWYEPVSAGSYLIYMPTLTIPNGM